VASFGASLNLFKATRRARIAIFSRLRAPRSRRISSAARSLGDVFRRVSQSFQGDAPSAHRNLFKTARPAFAPDQFSGAFPR
jgi:hypothetical protein